MASPESRQFFRAVVEKTIQEGKLKMPFKFAKDLSSPVFIKVPSGELWEMELTKCDRKMWLGKGWQNFAEHYHLEPGCILMFNYEGDCRFNVLIFGKNSLEIDYPPYPNGNKKTQQQEVKIEESESDELVNITKEISTSTREKPEWKFPQPRKRMRANPRSESIPVGFKHNNGFSAGKSEMRSTIQPMGPDEKSKALQRASTAFKSKNPFFLVFMQPSYVSTYLNIPAEFSRKYLNDSGNVILRDSNGKIWAAEYCSSSGPKTFVRLCSGWNTFVRYNNLQIGDVCAFELIDCIEISFKVFIYRGKKEGFHGSRDFTDAFCPAKREAGNSSTHRGCAEPLNASETAPQRAAEAGESALLRAQAFTSENPYFLLVLQPSYVQLNSLCIPSQFSRKHFNKSFNNADVILVSNGKSWLAEYHVYKARNFMYGRIANGWRAFVKDNNLKAWDVCVFELTVDTKISFKVNIFQDVADADYHPLQGVKQDPEGLTSQSPKAARERISMPPLFRRVVQPYDLKLKRMAIPYRFFEQYFKPNIQVLILKVADRSWPVKITSYSHHRLAHLTSGWIKFARENSLRGGDICVYELDTTSNGLLKVSISRSGH